MTNTDLTNCGFVLKIIDTLLNDYKNLAYILTDGGDNLGEEYYEKLDKALDRARQTFPDLQKIYEKKGN